MDQWFAIQASAPLRGTVDRVRQLLRHPDFDRNTPNRVRAVVGQFANANPVAFHRADGSGYQILCDEVSQLDRINPQIAARLLGSLALWPRLDECRQQEVGRLLKELDRPDISPDLAETLGRLTHAASRD